MGLFNDPYSHLGPKESDPVDTNAGKPPATAKKRVKWRAKKLVLLKTVSKRYR